MNLKRDNWTNQEVIDIILGLVPVDEDGKESIILSDFVKGLKTAAMRFGDFKCSADSYNALSFDADTGEIFHTGTKLPQ